MHPLLRTLDLTDPTGTESSIQDLHPIRGAAPANSRILPVALSLGLTPLLIYGLSISLISPTSRLAVQTAFEQASRSVALLLHEPAPPSGLSAPARNLVGREGPRGSGHREGSNTIDPRLVNLPITPLSKPSDAIEPDELSSSPKTERVFLSLNPALPLQVGGNGLARGTGRDAGEGIGGPMRPPTTVPVQDFRLVPTKQVQVFHRLVPGEEPTTKQPVRVRILIDNNGVPFQASVLSGPPFLYQDALKAAREWRFEPLEPHGLKAPIALIIISVPHLLPPS